jgi:tetraacyldisaccharide 4'-kinase
LLLPLSYLFGGLATLRRWLYKKEFFVVQRFPVPIIIVGNITVGGTGKTPFVIYLALLLRQKGYRPGIVSRGYKSHMKGSYRNDCQEVFAQSNPFEMGDEPVLIAHRTGCPVFVSSERGRAVEVLLRQYSCDVIISDDGLQHYALQRDIEIAILDGMRRLGNGWLLPAGPLRESAKRLRDVDYTVANGIAHYNESLMELRSGKTYNLKDRSKLRELKAWSGKTVHAVAGIGNPERFFDSLRLVGINIISHAFPDHYQFTPADVDFADDLPVIMTEKDAIKCLNFSNQKLWCVPVKAVVSAEFETRLLSQLHSISKEGS